MAPVSLMLCVELLCDLIQARYISFSFLICCRVTGRRAVFRNGLFGRAAPAHVLVRDRVIKELGNRSFSGGREDNFGRLISTNNNE